MMIITDHNNQLTNLCPDMCAIVRPTDPDNVLQPGEGGGQRGSQVVALHIHHLLLTRQGESQHTKSGRGIWCVRPWIAKFFNVWPQVWCGRGKSKDPNNLNIPLIHLLIEKTISVACRSSDWLWLPPEANEPVELLLHDVAGKSSRERILNNSSSRGVVAVRQASLAAADKVGHPDVPVVDEGDDVRVVWAHGRVQTGTTCLCLDLVREQWT